MPARIDLPPEKVVEAKYLYEQTDTSIEEIGARIGISRAAFYVRLQKWKWQRRRYSAGAAADADALNVPDTDPPNLPAGVPPDKTADCATSVDTEDNAELEAPEVFYARVCLGVQRQVTIIERMQKTLLPAGSAMQTERSARVLASINKALLEIQAVAKPQQVSDEADDSIPHDIEEFRAQLARRIRGLVDAEWGRSGQRAGGDPAE